MADGADLFAVEHLRAGYGEAVVLSDMTLRLTEGEVLALLGRNGTGKTTLINSIVGVTRRFGGKVVLAGRDITAMRPDQRARAGIGWVPQERNIFRSLTVEENMTAVAQKGPWTVDKVYEMFPLGDTGGAVVEGLGGDHHDGGLGDVGDGAVDVAGDVAGADGDGGLAGGVAGADHVGAAGGEDHVDGVVGHELAGGAEGGGRETGDEPGGAPARSAAWARTWAARLQQRAARGWGAQTMALPALTEARILKRTVEVGLVTGMIPATTPTGQPTAVVRARWSTQRTPTVRMSRRASATTGCCRGS